MTTNGKGNAFQVSPRAQHDYLVFEGKRLSSLRSAALSALSEAAHTREFDEGGAVRRADSCRDSHTLAAASMVKKGKTVKRPSARATATKLVRARTASK